MEDYFDLNAQTYDWCVRAFDQVRKVLGMRIKMHHTDGEVERGSIFLFNHFARVETFIPQYLIYKETGDYCRSIAAAQFFSGNDRFASALRDLGVVPNNHPHLMELLATDILRGRKVVVFPEGGMVKDRQVIDEQGRYNVYSRHARERRKHHTGAARLAIGLRIFQQAVVFREARGDHARLEAWAERAGLANADELIRAARRPVSLVPANITFYPLRISDNILRRGAELMSGKLSRRAIDELVVEGNFLLRATDMDINLGETQVADDVLAWYDRAAAAHLAKRLPDLGAIFDIDYLNQRLTRRLATRSIAHTINRVRDRYMRAIYQSATVNLSHLASTLLLAELEGGNKRIASKEFRLALYLAVKGIQSCSTIRLHRGLCNPETYQPLLDAELPALAEFLDSAAGAGLLSHDEDTVDLHDKLVAEHDFDAIRMENPIEVYANEVAPLDAVGEVAAQAMRRARDISERELADELFDDMQRSLAWDRALYSKPQHAEINARETATEDPGPFLFVPAQPKPVGVVLTHGFLASPAEVRAFGERLVRAGYAVVGVRLKGHGTSPWDLRDRSWRDWFHAVVRGRAIMRRITPRSVLVGFSTGGNLSLIAAAEDAEGLAGVVAICPPLKFRNRNMRFVPLMHGANRIVRWLSSYEGLMPFRPNESEHPHINYRNMPLRGLYELTRLASYLTKVLKEITLPVCVIQSARDHVVDPASASLVSERVSSPVCERHWVDSDRHGILNEDIGDTQQLVLDFLARVEALPRERTGGVSAGLVDGA